MTSLTDPDVHAFLLEGTRTAKLSYVAADGRPLIAPVWFTIEGDQLLFITRQASAKGKAMVRDPRVAICVDLEQPPYAFVQVQGIAKLSEDPARMLEVATATAARYMGPERAEEIGRLNSEPGGYLVIVEPSKVIAAFNMTG